MAVEGCIGSDVLRVVRVLNKYHDGYHPTMENKNSQLYLT